MLHQTRQHNSKWFDLSAPEKHAKLCERVWCVLDEKCEVSWVRKLWKRYGVVYVSWAYRTHAWCTKTFNRSLRPYDDDWWINQHSTYKENLKSLACTCAGPQQTKHAWYMRQIWWKWCGENSDKKYTHLHTHLGSIHTNCAIWTARSVTWQFWGLKTDK